MHCSSTPGCALIDELARAAGLVHQLCNDMSSDTLLSTGSSTLPQLVRGRHPWTPPQRSGSSVWYETAHMVMGSTHVTLGWTGGGDWRLDNQRGGTPEFSGEMFDWVLSGFSVGSQKMNIFQKVYKIISTKKTKTKAGSHGCSRGCSRGFSVGSQWVLSGYSAGTWAMSTQGTHGYSDCAFLSTQGVLR